jgi:hypothetical protein
MAAHLQRADWAVQLAAPGLAFAARKEYSGDHLSAHYYEALCRIVELGCSFWPSRANWREQALSGSD